MIDLFRYKSLRKETIGFAIISFTIHLIYFGGEYSISDISAGDGTYYFGAIFGLSETIGYAITTFLITKLHRRLVFIYSYIILIITICGFFFYGFSADSTKINCKFCFKSIEKLKILKFYSFYF